MTNIFLMRPDETLELPDYEFVCEECGEVYSVPMITVRPKMVYKIHRGLLLRVFELLEPLPQHCGHFFPNEHWLFHKPSQDQVTLEQIIELQNAYLESGHPVAKLPEYQKQVSPA